MNRDGTKPRERLHRFKDEKAQQSGNWINLDSTSERTDDANEFSNRLFHYLHSNPSSNCNRIRQFVSLSVRLFFRLTLWSFFVHLITRRTFVSTLSWHSSLKTHMRMRPCGTAIASPFFLCLLNNSFQFISCSLWHISEAMLLFGPMHAIESHQALCIAMSWPGKKVQR